MNETAPGVRLRQACVKLTLIKKTAETTGLEKQRLCDLNVSAGKKGFCEFVYKLKFTPAIKLNRLVL